jgi:cardiolipin synthase
MIPVFVYTYFEYTEMPLSLIAALVYIIAWVTDVLDGYLARRNNWITDVGKILDPIADKLMQIAAAICFALDNPIFWAVAIPLIIKEFSMLIGGIIVVKAKKAVVQALWYGKFATVVLFACAFTRIMVRGNAILDYVIAAVMIATLLFALTMYYLKVFRKRND